MGARVPYSLRSQAKRYCVRSYILPLRGEALSGYASWMGTPTWGRRSYRDEVPDLGGRAFLVGVFLCGVVWGGVR